MKFAPLSAAMHPTSSAPEDTLVAISTPPGRGGIGIVRLAGPDSLLLAEALLRLKYPLSLPEAHARATFAQVLDPASLDGVEPARTIDDCLVTAFHAPHSYTGGTLVEIAAHGSPVVLDALVRGTLAHGARLGLPVRLAGPGEFTQRAFLSGRLDLTQAEAVHDLIAAQTLQQARVAAQQLGGALSRRVSPAKVALLHLIALLEAGMDFASGELDDVDVVPPAQIALSIERVRTPLAALAATFQRGQLLRNGAAIALVGRPNAGKSSLFNRLLERERAIVTPLAGTTRDTLEETLSLDGIPLRLIDTAGLHTSAMDAAERQGIARTYEALADADLVLRIVDATDSDSSAQTSMDRTLDLKGRPHLVILNKVDLVAAPALPAAPVPGVPLPAAPVPGVRMPAAPEVEGPLRTSALTGFGLENLRSAILAKLNAAGSLAEAGLINNLRQQQAVTETLAALATAASANEARLPHELILVDLHNALQALDTLTGATTTEDILARIFSTFCIGK